MGRKKTFINVERNAHNGSLILTGYRVDPDATSQEYLDARSYTQVYYGYTVEEAKRKFRAYVKHEEDQREWYSVRRGTTYRSQQPTVHIRFGSGILSDPIEYV